MARWRARTLILSLGALVLVGQPTAGAAPPGLTDKASLAWDGSEGDGTSGGSGAVGVGLRSATSGHGRLVAFESTATNLVPDDENGQRDIFVRNLDSGETRRVSIATDGTESDRDSRRPAVSANGRYVAFDSQSRVFHPEKVTGRESVFVYDLVKSRLEWIGHDPEGNEPAGFSYRPSLSADGRYVAFQSNSTTIVPGIGNAGSDIFVHDRVTGLTERITRAWDGGEPNGSASQATISADGRFVAFQSTGSNLVPDDTNNATDVFVYDRETTATERVSVSTDGEQADAGATAPDMSADGRFVTFASGASNLVPRDTNGLHDVFVHDRGTGVTERVSVSSLGRQMGMASLYPQISGDGRYVVFEGFDDELAPGPGSFADAYVHDRHTRRTERVSVTDEGGAANNSSYQPFVNHDGRRVGFSSRAGNLGPGSSNGQWDVYVRDRGPDVGLLRPPTVVIGEGAALVEATATFAGGVQAAQSRPPEAFLASEETGASLTGASVAYRPHEQELVFRVGFSELPEELPQRLLVGVPGVVFGAAFHVDGVQHQVRAGAAAHPHHSVFAVLRCDPACRPLRTWTAGGLGTTGKEAVLPVALAEIGAVEGATVNGVRAFSGLGSPLGGVVVDLDGIDLGAVVMPERTAAVGVAPIGTPAGEVAFSPITVDGHGVDGTVELPGGLDEHAIFTRVCLGADCSVSVTPLG